MNIIKSPGASGTHFTAQLTISSTIHTLVVEDAGSADARLISYITRDTESGETIDALNPLFRQLTQQSAEEAGNRLSTILTDHVALLEDETLVRVLTDLYRNS